jgi:hypothetical protein
MNTRGKKNPQNVFEELQYVPRVRKNKAPIVAQPPLDAPVVHQVNVQDDNPVVNQGWFQGETPWIPFFAVLFVTLITLGTMCLAQQMFAYIKYIIAFVLPIGGTLFVTQYWNTIYDFIEKKGWMKKEKIEQNIILCMSMMYLMSTIWSGSNTSSAFGILHVFTSFFKDTARMKIQTNHARGLLVIFFILIVNWTLTESQDMGEFIKNQLTKSNAHALANKSNRQCAFNDDTNTLSTIYMRHSDSVVEAIISCTSGIYTKSTSDHKIYTMKASLQEVRVAAQILHANSIFLPTFNCVYTTIMNWFRFSTWSYWDIACSIGMCIFTVLPSAMYPAQALLAIGWIIPYAVSVAAVIMTMAPLLVSTVSGIFTYIMTKLAVRCESLIRRMGMLLLFVAVNSIYIRDADHANYKELVDIYEFLFMFTAGYSIKDLYYEDNDGNRVYYLNTIEFRLCGGLIMRCIYPLSNVWMLLLIQYDQLYDYHEKEVPVAAIIV